MERIIILTVRRQFYFIAYNVLRIREADNCVGFVGGIGGLLYTLLSAALLSELIINNLNNK